MDYHEPYAVRRTIGLLAICLALVKCVGLEAFLKVKNNLEVNPCPESPIFFKEINRFANLKHNMLILDALIVFTSLMAFCLAVVSLARDFNYRRMAHAICFFVGINITVHLLEIGQCVVHRNGVIRILSHYFAPFTCSNQKLVDVNIAHFMMFLLSTIGSFILLLFLFKKALQLHLITGNTDIMMDDLPNDRVFRYGLGPATTPIDNVFDGLPTYEEAMRLHPLVAPAPETPTEECDVQETTLSVHYETAPSQEVYADPAVTKEESQKNEVSSDPDVSLHGDEKNDSSDQEFTNPGNGIEEDSEKPLSVRTENEDTTKPKVTKPVDSRTVRFVLKCDEIVEESRMDNHSNDVMGARKDVDGGKNNKLHGPAHACIN